MLESYIAPFFTGYVDKYIKNLKPEDLSLSLWGGDVVLQNLEINLDVLQQELNLPVEFLSGKIHKFQLHVPWTRITYEPVIITIDTMEFIVKLKDSNDTAPSHAEKPATEEITEEETPDTPTNTEELPPGYVQGILNKVINNVSFQIKNIIIKYVEDDIVFSLNIKSLDFHSSDEDWNSAFTEIKLPDLLLHRVCDIADLTICLDQRNPSGKIELYQDPVLYKCNLSCRILSQYKGLSSYKPYENTLNVYCESFDFSFTDLQIPLMIRLIRLVIGLYYGSLDLPGCNVKLHTAPKVLDQHKLEHSRMTSNVLDEHTEEEHSESWTSWALSMVPGMAASIDDNKSAISKFDLKTTLGIYITLVTVTLKRTNQFSESVLAHQRLEFSPVLCMELCGLIIDFVAIGELLIDLNLGLQSVVGYTVGNQCVCSMSSPQKQSQLDDGCDEDPIEDDVFMKVGVPGKESEALSFLQRSLFSTYSNAVTQHTDKENAESEGTEEIPNESTEETKETHSEEPIAIIKEELKSYQLASEEIVDSYGGFYFNYYYEMFLPDLLSNEIENIFLYPDVDEPVNEISAKRIHIASCQLYLSTKFAHLMTWFAALVTAKAPERKQKTAVVLDSFVLGQLQIGNLLSRKFVITMNNLETHLMAHDHDSGKYTTTSYQEDKEALMFQLEDFEVVKVDPMYPVELVSMVERGKLVKLHKMENLNVQITLKATGAEAGLSYLNTVSLDSFSRMMLQPTNVEATLTYSLIPDTFETKTPCVKTDISFNCDGTTVMFTKIQALLFYLISASWVSEVAKSEINILVNSVFNSADSSNDHSPLMNIDVQGVMLRLFDMAELQGMSATISGALATLQTVGKEGDVETATIFQAPFDTEKLHTVETWLAEDTQKASGTFIELMLQLQKENCKHADTGIPLFGLKVAGAIVNFDHLLHIWLTYQIDATTRRKLLIERQRSALSRSMSTSMTSRRTKSYARVMGDSNASQSSPSKTKEKVPEIEESHNEEESHEPSEHCVEWIAKKMNFCKAFHVQVNIQSFVVVLPTDRWPSAYNSSNFVQMVGKVYQDDCTACPQALVVCLPKLALYSASEGLDIFQYTLPMIFTQCRKSKETFPWTITSKDLTIFTLFSQKEELFFNEKIETVYICKPVSWSIYLASTSQNNAVSKSVVSLGIIPEVGLDSNVPSPGRIIRSNIIQEKVGNCLSGKHVLGFVLHMDWSICECFVSLKQLLLVSQICTKMHSTWDLVALQKAALKSRSSPSHSCSGITAARKKNSKADDRQSLSTASIIDRAEGMSTITGSSSIFPITKGSPDCIDVSLWIQCTLPKVKCTVLSQSEDKALYQVISEIDEIMFAFDYQDAVLELTNKVAACVVYYSLLRFDSQPDGWTVIDHNYLLGQAEKYRSSHVDSKTLLSIVYRRTYQHSQSILSPDESDSNKKPCDLDHTSSSIINIQEENITKHEFNINILSIDLICFPKPILSSLNIFTQILPVHSENPSELLAAVSDAPSPDNFIMITTLPLLNIHCDSIRIIVPVEVEQEMNYSCIDNTESVFLFHMQSFDLHSSPVNPISKTVTDRVMYRQIKQSYRDVLKKLKLWNVQYQLDLTNAGLCTTNWKSLENSLPGKFAGLQNPALEWNSQPGYGHPVMTPIFPGFDFKATIAPPIISRTDKKMHPVTAAAFEFHSPKEVKLFINSSQIGLAINCVNEINSLVSEVTRIMQHSFPPSIEAIDEAEVFAQSEKIDFANQNSITINDVEIPCFELFSSVSSISIAIYLKEFKQPLISTIYPAFYINLMQPTFTFTSLKETKFQLKLHDLDIVSSSNFNGISSDSPVPLPGDFDLPLFSCGLGCVDERIGSTPVLLDVSASIEKHNSISLYICCEKPVYLQYNFALDHNIKLLIDNISTTLSSLKTQNSNETEGTSSLIPTNEDSSPLKVNVVSISAIRINTAFSFSKDVEEICVNVQYQKLKCCLSLVYSKDGSSMEVIDVKSQFDGIEVYFDEMGQNSTLLMPCNLKIDALFKFCLHSGNRFHKSLFPKIYLFISCGLMQLHANQHLYEIFSSLSSKMLDLMSTSGNCTSEPANVTVCESKDDDQITSVKDEGKVKHFENEDWATDFVKSEDDLRSGSFEYIVLKGDEMMIPMDNEILFTNDHYNYSPVMTWKYPQSRVITDISVLPVPFHVAREDEREPANLPCLLQYWDELNLTFATCQEFSLSENDSSTVPIIDPVDLEVKEYNLSEIWRVVVGISQDLESEAYEEEDEEEEGCQEPPELSVVPASSLAACMKVNSLYAAKLVPSLETKFSISKLSIISSNSLSSLGKGSPSDLSPFYIDETDCYPDLIEGIEFCFEELSLTASFSNSLNVILNFSSQCHLNVMDFNNLCWLRFLSPTPITIWLKQILAKEMSLDKMTINVEAGAAELFVTQTAVHTLSLTSKAWSNLLSNDPEFLVFNHYMVCNETDQTIHLQQTNTDEDIILHSGQMYPYSWCSKHSQTLRFCLDTVGDWKWSESIDLNEVGVFPKKLEHKKFTSLLFIENKRIGGIQKQVIFHGSCSFQNNLDFDVKLNVVTQQAEYTALHPTNIVNVSNNYIIPAGTSRPSITISPSFIKSVGISKKKNEEDDGDDEFVVAVPLQDEDTHFTVQVQDGEKFLLCWLSFDYTSKILGQLVVTITPQFIFRNHLPHSIKILANARDNKESVEMTFDGKGHETQVFGLFPQKWFNLHLSLPGSDKYSTTSFPLNTTMHQLLKENDYVTDVELDQENWPFLQGTKESASNKTPQTVCFKQIELDEISMLTPLQEEIKCTAACYFQATLRWMLLPTIVIDVKPSVLLTNSTDLEVFVKGEEGVQVVKSKETIAPFHIQNELSLGISVDEQTIWSSCFTIETSANDQQLPKKQVLSPGAVIHSSIMDPRTNYYYQFSCTCREVYGTLVVSLHKRFMLHNLSASRLTMVPLIFDELKDQYAFECLSAVELPPDSEHSFCLLNSFTSGSSQVPDGMAVNFKISLNDVQPEEIKNIIVTEYTIKKSESLQLSKDHLRESIILPDTTCALHPFVLTSGLDDGVVHIFIDDDISMAVTIHNKLPFNFMMKEVNVENLNKRAEVLLADISSLLLLEAGSTAFYQPTRFKDNFPKTDNKLELNCQFSLFSEDAAELSQPIILEKETKYKLFIPNHGEIFINTFTSDSKLYVELNAVEDENIAVCLNHLSIPLFHVNISSINAVLVDYSNHDKMVPLLSASFSCIDLTHIINVHTSVFKVTCGYLQVDNQLTGTFDHFPVLFLPMRQVSERYHTMTQDVPFPEVEACLEADVFSLTFEFNQSTQNGSSESIINNIRINMQPCEMYIEDTIIYRLANVYSTYLPRLYDTQATQPVEYKLKYLAILHPLRLCNIEVGEISILLSFHASVKMFLAADHIPLVFRRFKIMSTQTVMKEFIRSILYNYATQALVRVGWILGSLNIIGSPTGLIQSIGHGLSDFFVLPYNGLIRGPSAFVSGVSLGMSSLMRHVSTGALTSLNNVSSSISRNMDRLSFDELHVVMQEESRADSPTKVSKGFSKAFESLGMSLLGAVAGIVDHPLQNVTEAHNTSEVVSGLASGLAKGIIGMFTKPIGGAMEFVSQASQGILQGAGLVRVPEKVFILQAGHLDKLLGEASQMKYMWQYLHSERYAEILVVPNVLIKTSSDGKVKGEKYGGALILSEAALLVYNSDTNQVSSIFPLKEVELQKLEDKILYKLQIYKHTSEQQFSTASLDENPNFRQFFDSFRDAALISHTEVLCENLSNRTQHAVLEVELDQIYGELLITLCQTRKIKLLEDAYVLDCVDL